MTTANLSGVDPNYTFNGTNQDDAPIHIEDVVGKVWKNHDENDRPYDTASKKLHNETIHIFETKVFDNLCNSKKEMSVKKALKCLFILQEGLIVRSTYNSRHLIFNPPDDLLQQWKNIFASNGVKELAEYGVLNLQKGAAYIAAETFNRSIEEKYNEVFFDDNYLEWINRFELNILMFKQPPTKELTMVVNKLKAVQEAIVKVPTPPMVQP